MLACTHACLPAHMQGTARHASHLAEKLEAATSQVKEGMTEMGEKMTRLEQDDKKVRSCMEIAGNCQLS